MKRSHKELKQRLKMGQRQQELLCTAQIDGQDRMRTEGDLSETVDELTQKTVNQRKETD